LILYGADILLELPQELIIPTFLTSFNSESQRVESNTFIVSVELGEEVLLEEAG
jgi:hypothetical protein